MVVRSLPSLFGCQRLMILNFCRNDTFFFYLKQFHLNAADTLTYTADTLTYVADTLTCTADTLTYVADTLETYKCSRHF